MNQISYNRALSKAMAICSKAEKCSFDIISKLGYWNADENDIAKIINKLREEKFIDDERYTRFFVQDKFKFNKWGKIKIAFMLKGKKIPAEIIQQVLNDIDHNEYIETLTKLLSEKALKIKFADEYDRKAKLTRYAQSRGFEYEIISNALSSIKDC